MKPIIVIWKKEFKSYFSGPGFYLLTGIYAAFLSFSFLMLLRQYTQRSAMYMIQTQGRGGGLNLHEQVFVGLISNVNLLILILPAFLTAKLIAEEKKMKSFDLLLTSPITSTHIVVGKFLAAVSVIWLLILGSIVYPASLAFFTDIQWGVLLSGYLGLLMVGAMYGAISLFASSISQSSILSGFASIIMSLTLWFVAWASMELQDSKFSKAFDHILVARHFSELIKGNLQVATIVFGVSVVGLFCFLAERVVESSRWRA